MDESRAEDGATWLYGLNKTEWALENLDKSIDLLEHKLSRGIIQAMQFDNVQASNHEVSFPTEDKTVAMLGDPERLEYLKILREAYQAELVDYSMTIERMTISEKWGQLGKDIIHVRRCFTGTF